jgi:hypothetical protein
MTGAAGVALAVSLKDKIRIPNCYAPYFSLNRMYFFDVKRAIGITGYTFRKPEGPIP